ncbi:alpha/beta-hydrolase [Coprinopsis marcescibilis]|uniref:Carboxylic ester hydrolase n=1 Tax=Coprinopsis marcescibilis TaxID=230819 RepID=A0A5C3L6S3_COPMA|nr:alpha/beta-hydrolase [Coprinopsis marcescibilis]
MRSNLLLVALLSQLHSSWGQTFSLPTVNLGYASYQGLVNPETQNTEFLGIRYAAAPTGNLRWRKPQPPGHQVGLQLANAQPNICPQAPPGTSSSNPYAGLSSTQTSDGATPEQTALETRQLPVDPSGTEDCLFLNVYAPGSTLNETSNLPVIVWIHGGGYILGSASGLAPGLGGPYDGNDLIRRSGGNVIVVVIQYRLGLFGFLAGAQVKKNGVLNAGLLDQQFALKWVQRHITKFGGDPSKVTIWGESAGAGSVLQQLIANGGSTSPPLFRSAILSSTFLPPQFPFNHPTPEIIYSRALELTGCADGDCETQLSCLRSVDMDVLQAANVQLNNDAFSGTFAFVPVIDGSFIREDPTQSLSNGRVNTRHILAVSNGAEGPLFVNPAVTPESTPLGDYLLKLFPRLRAQDVTEISNHYNWLNTNIERFTEIMAEAIFVCPTYLVLQSANDNAYKALFAVPPALHADDIGYYFPTVVPPGFNNPEFIQAFAQSFVDFTLSQDPNIKQDPTSILPQWPRWTESSPAEMLFNRSGDLPDINTFSTAPSLTERCQFWQSISEFTFQ